VSRHAISCKTQKPTLSYSNIYSHPIINLLYCIFSVALSVLRRYNSSFQMSQLVHCTTAPSVAFASTTIVADRVRTVRTSGSRETTITERAPSNGCCGTSISPPAGTTSSSSSSCTTLTWFVLSTECSAWSRTDVIDQLCSTSLLRMICASTMTDAWSSRHRRHRPPDEFYDFDFALRSWMPSGVSDRRSHRPTAATRHKQTGVHHPADTDRTSIIRLIFMSTFARQPG